ncbi:MAG TPA: phosphoribosylpyrophosphate synthetase [Lachnospiraceae bacterium]|jgi:ribose-phosphate pyrophosphokinase|nr:phosphoribosylpyrophosphate synthetase [Lachnospiraceae bacterium]
MSELELHQQLERRIPAGPLGLIVMPSARELGDKVNEYLVSFRREYHNIVEKDPAFEGYQKDDYRMDAECVRFGTGEGKATIRESCRGKDIYIITDVMNHSLTYRMNGFTNHYSPDDHFQDLKRIIAAINGKAERINVIMPFLYEGRQHKRSGRESLDASMMLKELEDLGISNFITFDAHDPRIQNVAPLSGFDNFISPYQFLRVIMHCYPDIVLDKDHFVVISPDEGALDRAVYFASVINADTGMFYKRRDYAHVVNGKNPIVAHEFLGSDLEGKDVIIMDDMISSGGSILDTAKQLKAMHANHVFLCTTFGLFTDGLERFDKAYADGVFDCCITTNLTWQPAELLSRPWFQVADMSKYLATIIDFFNHNASIASATTPTNKIHELLAKYNRHEASELESRELEETEF